MLFEVRSKPRTGPNASDIKARSEEYAGLKFSPEESNLAGGETDNARVTSQALSLQPF